MKTLLVALTGVFIYSSLLQAEPTPPLKKSIAESIGLDFVLVPPGSFMMGSPEKFKGAQKNEKPQHKVTITKAFEIGKHEITLAQWEAVMGTSPFKILPRSNNFYEMPGMATRITKPNHPATVSWQDAQDFIKKLNEKEGQNRYRLPTEAEWEYAARAGTTTNYSFGDNVSDLGKYAWFGEDFKTGGTHPVGQKEPNAWGLYDVHGNVWEWVQDLYDTDYYKRSPAIDPQGPSKGNGHTVRGGSWHSTSKGWHTAIRKGYETNYRGISIGFRLVRNVE
jgi:formylglycine-generating enzyme required for sulfatase activity